MKKIILLVALLLPAFAFAEASWQQEVNRLDSEQTVQDDRLDSIEMEQLQQNDRLATIETIQSLQPIITKNEYHQLMTQVLNNAFIFERYSLDLYSCGQFYIVNCTDAVSGGVYTFASVDFFVEIAGLRMRDTVTGIRLGAVTTDIVNFTTLRFVGTANSAYSFQRGKSAIVDDCDDPTTVYIDPSAHTRGINSPVDVMDNAGLLYTRDSNVPSGTQVVDGGTYGVMNFIAHGDVTTPICTSGQTGFTGTWNKFTYTYALDTNDPQFAGPFTWSGTATGLIDRVEALENP